MLTFDDFPRAYEKITELEPDFTKLSVPKRFSAPGDYLSFTKVFLPSAYENAAAVAKNETNETINTGYVIWAKLIQYAVPVFYVDEQLCKALAATAPPQDLTLSAVKWPMPAMVFMLPTRFTHAFFNRQVNYISAAMFAPNETLKPPGRIAFGNLESVIVQSTQPQINMYCSVVETSSRLLASYSLHTPIERKVSEVVHDDIQYHGELLADNQTFDPKQDNEFTNRVFSFVVKLLLVMTARPIYVEYSECLRTQKQKHGRIRDALWAPNYVGRNYRVIRESSALIGTHASPRLHWRRGHIRNQPYGESRALSKVIWLEPCLIGANEDTNASKSLPSPSTPTKP